MFYSLYLIDSNHSRYGRNVEGSEEPFIIYSSDVLDLKTYLGNTKLPHECSSIDGSLYLKEDADITLEKNPNGIQITFRPGLGLPSAFYSNQGC